MNLKTFFVVGAMVLFVPSGVFAEPIIRSGETVSVEKDQLLEGDFYGLGSTVTVSGEANHDVYIAGRSVTINAPIKGDLVVFGGNVQVHASVADDVRVLGGEVTIGGEVKGDVVVLGGLVDILSSAVIEGDLLFMSGEIDVGGEVKGSVHGGGKSIRIDAPIGGDVIVTVHEDLRLGDRTSIEGSVVYRSARELIRSQDAVIVGTIQKKTFIENEAGQTIPSLFPILMLLFAGLSLYLLAKPKVEHLILRTSGSYGVRGLVGIAALILVPFVSVLLMTSILGFFVGILCLLIFFILVLLAWILSGAMLGTLLLMPMNKQVSVTVFSVMVGTVAFGLLPLLPFAGIFLALLVFVVTLGAIVTELYRLFR